MEKKATIISFIVLFALLLGMGGLYWTYVKNPFIQSERAIMCGETDAEIAADIVTREDGWQEIDPQNGTIFWGTGYDITLTNNTSKEIIDWCLTYNIPGGSYISKEVDHWGGGFDWSNQKLTVIGTDDNKVIPAGKSIRFGCIMYTPDGPINVSSAHIEITQKRSIFSDPIFWGLCVAVFTNLVVMITIALLSMRYRRVREKMAIYRDVSEQSLRTFAKTIDAKDKYTSGHSYRVAVLSRELALRMGLSKDDQERIYYIALLHDIGKIAVPDSILTKAGPLTDEERVIIKKHTTVGGDILAGFTAIDGISDGARFHHERYDGKGYMSGISGNSIPLCARIICVADSYDAMSSARCYRPALSKERILEELDKGTGTQFDPNIVCHMIDMMKDGKADIEQ